MTSPTTMTTTSLEEEPRICHPGGGGQWLPLGGEWELNLSPRVRLIMYFAGMIYSFLGVSIVADMFMAAIERLTSVQKCVRIGTSKRYSTAPVWNETVANLTLMALGSSAPEIMLSLNDIIKRTFVQGKLGASTIVGSAAFNLFVIIAVCINSIPAGESRQIKETGVYAITAFFSVFAYLWMLFICVINSMDEIELWEGTVTFLYFPILVVVSYYADIGVLTIDNIRSKLLPNRGSEEDTGPKTWLEKFKVDNAYEEEIDEEEKARREAEAKAREAARLAKGRELGAARGEDGGGRCSCITRCCRRKKAQPDEEETQLTTEEENTYLSDPNIPLIDDDGEPLENDFGILTFMDHSININVDTEEKEVILKVVRKNGHEGKVTCTYRTEQLSAIPGFDYEEDEGEIQFRDGVTMAEIAVTILPKKAGERNDKFQVVLEEPTGGAEFNPDFDGGEECQRLTINLVNDAFGSAGLSTLLDRFLNLDEMRQGTQLWKEQVLEALFVGGSKEEQDNAGFLAWVNHLVWLPWTGTFALLTPPPAYLGGWVCFAISLGHIAWLTIIIGDMAELFGCVADIDDNITAISFVALGTSVPDLFASMTAAKQDEYADASIVNVTGSNSVNVFLGIGGPWMLAAFYWYLKGTTFAMSSQGLGFSVIVFTCGALVTLALIGIRRWKFEGELGGPSDAKAYSSFLLILLWLSYIGLSTWKFQNMEAPLEQDLLMLSLAIPIIATVLAIFGGIRVALRISKDYIGEEGFWGVFVSLIVVGARLLVLFMFQWQ
eukprot:TRINITY_DN8083_c0_g1_i1.p1 TRINITY_DN8083_c0_g1~~TRINITY_DN8083_c0_g1_i1.p1  ORF type:complete len:777 (+),score=143.21 TRINITY_DN8083_c0_g1_i1:29-2359(+)